MSDVDPRDAAAFVQDLIDVMEITDSQAPLLASVLRDHNVRARVYEDSCGCHNAAPHY